jgi:hypothetical protein
MLKLIGMITVVYLLFHFGIVQVLAIWGMAMLAMVASI